MLLNRSRLGITVGRLAAGLLLCTLLQGACVTANHGGGEGGSGAGGVAPGAGGHGTGGGGGATSTGGAAGKGGSGAGGAAGAGSGATGGAAGSAAIAPCAARAGLLFCDDFEKAAAGSAPAAPSWSVIKGSGVVTVDATAPAHSGGHSVRVSPLDGDFQNFFVFHDPAVLPAPAGKFFLRFFIKVSLPMSTQHNTYVVLDRFAQPGGGNAVRLGEDVSMLMMTVAGDAHGYLSNQNVYNDGKPGVVFTPGAWTCVEMSFDPAATTIDTWVNGVEVPDMHPTNIQQDQYDDLRFGFEKYAGPVGDIWYDDVAIGTSRITCN